MKGVLSNIAIVFFSVVLLCPPFLQVFADEVPKGGINIQFTASSLSIHKGDAVTLSWQSNAGECASFAHTLDTSGQFMEDKKNEWSQDSSGLLSATSTQIVHPALTTLYVLECFNKKEDSFANTRSLVVIVDGSKPAAIESPLTLSNVKMDSVGPITRLSFEFGNARIANLSFFSNLVITKDGIVSVQTSSAFNQKPQDINNGIQTLIMKGDTAYSYTLDLQDPSDGRTAHYEGTFQTGENPLNGQKIICLDTVTQKDLFRIPLADFNLDTTKDSAGSGLSDELKIALGLDLTKASTNGNGYDDKTNLLHGYDPVTPGSHKLPIDHSFADSEKGCILDEQISGKEYMWYVHPTDSKMYYFGNPTTSDDLDAYLKNFGMQKDTRAIRLSSIGFTKRQSPYLYVVPEKKSFKASVSKGKSYTLYGITFKTPWTSKEQKRTTSVVRFANKNFVLISEKSDDRDKDFPKQLLTMNLYDYYHYVLSATPEQFNEANSDDKLLATILELKKFMLSRKPTYVYVFQAPTVKGFYYIDNSQPGTFEGYLFKGGKVYDFAAGGSQQQIESLLTSMH